MTSKNLFFKVMKNDLSRRIWNIAIAFLGFFVTIPLCAAIGLSNIEQEVIRGNILPKEVNAEYARLLSSGTYAFAVLLTVFLATFLAFAGFSYLYSKSKVDLFHSIAVKRTDLFGILYINGIIIYLVPYIFCMALYFIIGGVNGLIIPYTFKVAGITMLNNIAYFILIYNVTILAIVMTGNLLVGGLGTLVFEFFGACVFTVREYLGNQYLQTYYPSSSVGESISSPFISYLYSMYDIRMDEYALVGKRIAIVLVIAVVILVLDIVLYQKRPSESCAKAMAFKITEAPIRIIVTLLAAVFGGLLFFSAAFETHEGWILFGVVFIAIIVHGIIEIIFNSDFKSFFNAKLQLLAVVVCALVVSFGAKYDWFGYDSYLPKKENLKEIYIDFSQLNSGIQYYSEGNYFDRLEISSIENLDAAYNIASECAENHSLEQGENLGNVSIKYVLNSGREVYREYRAVSYENVEQDIADIYNSKDYKEDMFPIMTRENDSVYNIQVYLPDRDYVTALDMTEIEKNEFIEAFRQDTYNITLNDIKESKPITYVNFIWENKNGVKVTDGEYYIYPAYTNVLKLIENYCGVYEQDIEKMDISYVTVENSNYKGETGLMIENYASEIENVTDRCIMYTIKDREIINQLSDCWVQDTLNDHNAFRKTTYQIYVTIDYTTEGGREQSVTGIIDQRYAPDWIEEMLTN